LLLLLLLLLLLNGANVFYIENVSEKEAKIERYLQRGEKKYNFEENSFFPYQCDFLSMEFLFKILPRKRERKIYFLSSP